MKWMIAAFAAIALAIFGLSIPEASAASDGRMTGSGNCSGGVCTRVSCPAGTCSKAGTADAYDIRNCSKTNCRKK
jgi:hypothetical protein